ncbi:Haloacid Dehalogenase Superfamily Class (subfamily) IIA [Nocardiopsis flavescens]|uniref:Haloacid Dehalogenase Superfamily Class (Subfamily) IIA n=1 Tax=Nocardiopsis flavescens TaxID=758803 RepID=A0A1M6Q779_9ACTN|nr:HAD-IIA family hydrolase [Nocardiopsis flavescens]SHK16112.1 Haloacid Dehalogenase Superfamily Class (subfamily) IIA [Nocardiopsis flavescens]
MSLLAAERPLSTIHDAMLLDLDGVVYIGPNAVPAAPEAVDKARAAGARVAFVTNNAGRTPARIAEHLTQLGVNATPQDVVTSAEAAARLVSERHPQGSQVLVVGDTGLRQAVRRMGLVPVTVAGDSVVAVVQGYSRSMSRDLLDQGSLAVSRGALYVASNDDATAPTEWGVTPANGSFVRVISHATGVEPIIAGKPMRPLHEEGMRRTGARDPLIVGDRLDTDIEGAIVHGAAGLLVLSGVATPQDVLAAPEHRRPNYLSWDVSGMNDTHPGVDRIDGGTRCGGWTVTRTADGPIAEGSGDRLDGLRALCTAVWEDPETDPAGPAARAALAALGW